MIDGIKMKPSRVLNKLRSGEVAICIKLNLADSRVFEIAAMAGFDCLWTDMEHVANDWSVIERQVLASKAHGCDLLVRVSRGGYSDYTRPLELDASGIMVPHIMSYEDASKVVGMSRFYPLGRRPLDGGNADGGYCNIDILQYMRDANEKRFVVLQIEDPEPMNEIDRIASLDGVDMLFFGPGDFSQGMGAPAQWEDKRINEARLKVVEAAMVAGKYAGTVGNFGNLEVLIDMGYRFISMGADVLGLSDYFSSIVSRFQKVQKKSAERY